MGQWNAKRVSKTAGASLNPASIAARFTYTNPFLSYARAEAKGNDVPVPKIPLKKAIDPQKARQRGNASGADRGVKDG